MAARKLNTGQAHRFRWWPPDGVIASSPILTVMWPTGATTYTLALAPTSSERGWMLAVALAVVWALTAGQRRD
jgi:hypothetical protein